MLGDVLTWAVEVEGWSEVRFTLVMTSTSPKSENIDFLK